MISVKSFWGLCVYFAHSAIFFIDLSKNRTISGTYENNIYLIILQYQHHSNINNKVKAKTLILRSLQQFTQLGICLLQICCPIDTIEQRE